MLSLYRQIKALEPDQSPTRPTSITDVQDRLKADYLERQYFVTGVLLDSVMHICGIRFLLFLEV